jgi:hypothetical protein
MMVMMGEMDELMRKNQLNMQVLVGAWMAVLQCNTTPTQTQYTLQHISTYHDNASPYHHATPHHTALLTTAHSTLPRNTLWGMR